jgi:hypothetical protein
MKRPLAENQPTVFAGDPDKFAAALAYARREIEEDLQLIGTVRRHVARILSTTPSFGQNRRTEKKAVERVRGWVAIE